MKSNPENSHPAVASFAYFAGVIVLAALCSPPLYWLGQSLADHGILPFLKGFPFHRYFSRCLQIAALVLLFPAFRLAGIRRLSSLGIGPNPGWKTDLAAGFTMALLPVCLLSIGYICTDVYAVQKAIPASGFLKIILTAGTVAVLEEFLFRGVLLGICVRKIGPAGGSILSAIVFSGVHFLKIAKPVNEPPVGWLSGFEQIPLALSSAPPWPLSGWATVSLFVAGILLAAATLQTRSLFLPIGLHAGWIFGQQGLQLVAKFHVKPPQNLLPWVGENVVSGAVPTGLLPLAALGLTAAATLSFLKYGRSRRVP